MIGLRTKKEDVCHSHNLGDPLELLNLAIKSLDSKEIPKVKLNEILRLLELLKTATLVKQDLQGN